MAQIQPVDFPIIGQAVELDVLILNFKTSDVTCTTYYQLLTEDKKQCLQGNYQLSDEEFAQWGVDNSYIDDIIANHLGVIII